jgi:predicted amino acid racemase
VVARTLTGDLREGILPDDLVAVVRETLSLAYIVLKGLGTNLTCRSGASPDDTNMGELSRLAALIEATFDISIETVSGGNSANLEWASGSADTGPISHPPCYDSLSPTGCQVNQSCWVAKHSSGT